MTVQGRTLAQLKEECQRQNLVVKMISKSKMGKRDYVKALSDHFLPGVPQKDTWGFQYRRKYETPGVCQRWNVLKPSEQQIAIHSKNWIADLKENGVRLWVTYDPEYGFDFYSRNISVETYNPVSYRTKIWLGKDDNPYWKNVFKSRFVLDAEVISTTAEVSTVMGKRGVITETPLQAVTALLALNSEESLQIQRDLNMPLELRVWDCVVAGNQDFIEMGIKLRDRIPFADKIVAKLASVGLSFKRTRSDKGDKVAFLKEIQAENHEGVIYKNLDSVYVPTESRRRDVWVKFKRDVSSSLGDTVDGWVSGYQLGKEGSGWEKLVGSLEITVTLQPSGEEHVIANVTNLPMEYREKITVEGPNGPEMDKSMYDKVVEIDGQDISARKRALTHSRIIRFREDKTKFECMMDEEFLNSQIL